MPLMRDDKKKPADDQATKPAEPPAEPAMEVVRTEVTIKVNPGAGESKKS